MPPALTLTQRLAGLLLGTAVGDALGLPAEGLPPDRIRRRWPDGWRLRLVGRWGMWSDDTEHAFLAGQCLAEAPRDVTLFRRRLATRLRWWFAALPPGVGLATARACLKLWLGFPPDRSGVASAGNGPAMRSPLLGACLAHDAATRRAFVDASTRLTHTDPRALAAARAMAEAAAAIVTSPDARSELRRRLPECGPLDDWQRACRQIDEALDAGRKVGDFARSLGLEHGVTGYALHTVPVALYAWLRHPGDFRGALTPALDCGGDTDTVGALVGALAGCEGGPGAVPAEWVAGIREWPRGLPTLEALAHTLADTLPPGRPGRPVRYFRAGVPARNVVLLVIVLAHGLRRLLPPW